MESNGGCGTENQKLISPPWRVKDADIPYEGINTPK